MQIVFCADRAVLPGLHVAAYSLLDRMNPKAGQTDISVFSDVLDESDMALLRRTLTGVGKPFTLELRRVDPKVFAGFPTLNGSVAAYFRLLAPHLIDTDRFLYLDTDTLCDLDVYPLRLLDMGTLPAGWVPEAPLPGAVDREVAVELGNGAADFYFNSGVILVNVPEWRRQRVTENAMNYVCRAKPLYHDQSALNVVLHRNAVVLDAGFNFITNVRKNWPALKQTYGRVGKLMHLVEYPKPWDFPGEWVHPQYRLWRGVLDRTAMQRFRSWKHSPTGKRPQTRAAWMKIKKTLKDRLLFACYSHGLFEVKGVPASE